jgi:hypothetical protein
MLLSDELCNRSSATSFGQPIMVAADGRVVKRTGDGAIVEFRSVVEANRTTGREHQPAKRDKPKIELIVYPAATHMFAMLGLNTEYLGHRMV